MRSTLVFKRAGLTVACGVLVLVLGGCPKHENFPTALEITVPPTPSNFNITVPSSSTTYTFEWEISDPASVKGYRLYNIGLFATPELLADETTITGTEVTPPAFGYSLSGLQFGVSAVSIDNVEGPMAVAVAP
jgi:hypothetical protein